MTDFEKLEELMKTIINKSNNTPKKVNTLLEETRAVIARAGIISPIKWAEVKYDEGAWSEEDARGQRFFLASNHTDEELEEFFKSLDFTYDSGYGMQQVFGNIVFWDGTWLSRGEYDGSEWWEVNRLPQEPKC